MSRIGLILLALILAVATTAVPANRAAKAFGQLAESGGAQRLAAPDASTPRGTTAPVKRCQSGVLSCPFYGPAVSGIDPPHAFSSGAYMHVGGPVLSGRSVPTPLRPPKHVSA